MARGLQALLGAPDPDPNPCVGTVGSRVGGAPPLFCPEVLCRQSVQQAWRSVLPAAVT